MEYNIEDNQHYNYFKTIINQDKDTFIISKVDHKPYEENTKYDNLYSILLEYNDHVYKHTYTITETFTIEKALKIFYNSFVKYYR